MSFMTKSFVLALAALLPAAVHAGGLRHKVTVGADGKLLFDPEYLQANLGDYVTFKLSSFDTPCDPLHYGFDTDLVPVAPGTTELPEYTLYVNHTKPMWFYCKQKNPMPHCQQGMVFAINPPPEGDPHSFSAFKNLAIKSGDEGYDHGKHDADNDYDYDHHGSDSYEPKDHKIIVGVDAKLAFGPANITAEVGDTVTFEFRPKAHGVTQSSFNEPCTPLAKSSSGHQIGFESGIMPVAPNATYFPTFTIKINDTKPIWGYCPQTMPTPHCGQGMVFSINAIEHGPNNFAAFLDIAKQAAQSAGR
ncbi:hypothetical protein V5O48_000906 [Marasmius crinis-equi]|uniref:Cupredoxin n=1 Tax=Marasmius crinis-equi TaxID=585013 RepID=A0ABR3G115_9AGAR